MLEVAGSNLSTVCLWPG